MATSSTSAQPSILFGTTCKWVGDHSLDVKASAPLSLGKFSKTARGQYRATKFTASQFTTACQAVFHTYIVLWVYGFNSSAVETVKRLLAISQQIGCPVLAYIWAGWDDKYHYRKINTPSHVLQATRGLNVLTRILSDATLPVTSSLLVGHSMGCRLLCRALEILGGSTFLGRLPGTKMALFAGDIDQDSFQRILQAERQDLSTAPGEERYITVFVSNHDIALKSSRCFENNYNKIGDSSRCVTYMRGLCKTIDASEASTGLSDVADHSYCYDSPNCVALLRDILEGRGVKMVCSQKTTLRKRRNSNFSPSDWQAILQIGTTVRVVPRG